MNNNVKMLCQDYMDGIIELKSIPVDKLNWSLLGRAAVKEPNVFIDYMFYLCEVKKINIDIINCIGLLPSAYLSQELYDRAFKINPKKNFYLIPKKFRTEEMCNIYNSLVPKKGECGEVSKISIEQKKHSKQSKRSIEQQKYSEAYRLDAVNNFRKIPNGYKTQEMCDNFFDIDPSNHFYLIPGKFLTQRMCNIFYELDPINNYEKIPNRFRAELFRRNNALVMKTSTGGSTFQVKSCDSMSEKKKGLGQEFYDTLFAKNPKENFKYIPFQNRTLRMYEILASLTVDYNFLFQIPVQYRTQRIYEIFYNLNSKEVFILIPDNFKTQKMCTEMLEIDFEKYFPYVPECFYTQEMCDRYFALNPVNNIGKIPVFFRTQDMMIKIFNIEPELLLQIEFSNGIDAQKMYNKIFYLDPFKAFDVIPYKFKTAKMCKILYSLDAIKAFLIIPIEFITEDMSIDVMNKAKTSCQFNKILCKIPSEYKKQRFYETLFDRNAGKYFTSIPLEYRTRSMYITMLNIDLKKYSLEIPIEFCDNEALSIVVSGLKKYVDEGITIESTSEVIMTAIKMYPSLFKVLDEEIQDNVIFNELYLTVSSGGTRNSVARKYNLTPEHVSLILERFKDKNVEMYSFIKAKLEENKVVYFSNMLQDISNLGNIIVSLGPIDINLGLTKEQKIKFAYLFVKHIHYPLSEIYSFDYKKYNAEYADIINSFFRFVLKYDALFSNFTSLADKSVIKLNNSWLYKYDRIKFFRYKNGMATSHYTYGVDREKLTPKIEQYIIGKLKENNIPLNNMIVQVAFYEYFRGTLDEFILRFCEYDKIHFKKRIRSINN